MKKYIEQVFLLFTKLLTLGTHFDLHEMRILSSAPVAFPFAGGLVDVALAFSPAEGFGDQQSPANHIACQ